MVSGGGLLARSPAEGEFRYTCLGLNPSKHSLVDNEYWTARRKL